MKKRLLFCVFMVGSVLAASKTSYKSSDHVNIQIVKVDKTIENANTSIEIIIPEENEVISSSSVKVQMRVLGFPLKINSDFERKDEIFNYPVGQSIHVVLDDNPYFIVTEKRVDPFDDEALYFQAIYEFDLPDNLTSGFHSLRAFLCRSYGESLKNKKTFSAIGFYYKDKEEDKKVSLNKPYLLYNEPSYNGYYLDRQPILLDFLVKNCALSKDGYRVKLKIDDRTVEYLDDLGPYYIYGLGKGSHTIEIELVDKGLALVHGNINKIKKTIKIH